MITVMKCLQLNDQSLPHVQVLLELNLFEGQVLLRRLVDHLLDTATSPHSEHVVKPEVRDQNLDPTKRLVARYKLPLLAAALM